MRILVTGRQGQVVTALMEMSAPGVTIVARGRPELDLEQPGAIRQAIRDVRPDVVVSAAAWTAVDDAEKERERAFLANEAGARAVAEAAASIAAPVIHLSTDYVFSGDLNRAYREDDATGPTGVYGASKLAGERAVAAAHADHAILRTSWVHAPYGKNFLRTMLRLAESRDEVSVVSDQRGTPTYAPDIAMAVMKVARNLVERRNDAALRGVFHLAGSGDTASWADFADAIFAGLAARTGKQVAVKRISTAEFPTPARRPTNSRLDGSLIERTHGVVMPPWRDSVERSLDRLIGPRPGDGATPGPVDGRIYP